MNRQSRITSDPAISHGRPTVRGLRHPVDVPHDLLWCGMTIDEILSDYPDLEREDLLAVIEFVGDDGPPRRSDRFAV